MSAKPATAKQLSYLRSLANRTGQTFTYPHTAAQASRKINRLKGQPAEPWADRRRERHEIADAIQAGPADAAARIQAGETTGYGSSATWTQNQPQQPVVAEQDPPARRSRPSVGARSELGTYVADGKRRRIIGQRVDGVVRVSDIPDDRGRCYLIDRGLESKAELDALVADYLHRARQLHAVPMAVVAMEIGA